MDEHQQDANSALMELDKGLRAHKVGEQCEAIVRFPSLFARFPFPILINSAFLKLADAFRTGNNFMRLCIVRVAQQSLKHLDKILNVDEFMKRIYVVIHSNDPYARALTLRMLGSVSCIISEKKNAHHSIQQGLDSHDRIEQEAAIFATTQFASHSHNFASSICNKLSSMLQGLSTPLEIKLKLIPVMQHMHFNVQISSKARGILQDLLPSYPAQDFVLMTLNTLTQLSMHSLLDIPEQVKLLLKYFRCDPREAVKSDSIHNLNILAKSTPHLWTTEDIAAIYEAFQLSTLTNSLKRGIIHVLNSLAESQNLLQLGTDEESPILQLCQECCYDLDVIQAALSTKLFASLMRHVSHLRLSRQNKLKEEAIDVTESLLLLLAPSSERSQIDFRALKIVASSLKPLCSSCKDADSRIANVVVSLLASNDVSLYSKTSQVLLESLASIAYTSHTSGLLVGLNSKLFQLLRSNSNDGIENCKNEDTVKTLIYTLLFISNQEQGRSSLNNRLMDGIESSNLNHWVIYRVARQASRTGQHAIANKLFSKISHSVSSEQHYFWLVGLSDLSLAESVISKHFFSSKSSCEVTDHIEHLTRAIHHYQQAITYLTAAVTPNHTLTFQCEYARLRCEALQAHAQLLNACSLVRTCPPPAISTVSGSGEGTSGDTNYHAANAVLTTRMKSCANWFLKIDKSYSDLHMTSFDSDPPTLSNIDLLQQCCSIMAYAIDVLILSRSSRQSTTLSNLSVEISSEDTNNNNYTKAVKNSLSSVTKMIGDLIKTDSPTQPLSHVQTNCLAKCSSTLLSVSHSFPRYFYQSLQTTNIKLAISPNQHANNEPVTVEINNLLSLKVEGVIQHENTRSQDISTSHIGQPEEFLLKNKFRYPEKIKLTMKKIRQGQAKNNNTKADDGRHKLEQTVEPHNDYFSTQFLIAFPIPGIFNVVIETNVKDDKGVWWNTGTKETILVKAFDDSIRTQAARPGRS